MTKAAENLVWKALAEPARRRVLDLLAKRPHTTGELVACFDEIGRCAVMKHLGVLESAGLVLATRQGRNRWNHLNPVPIQRIYDRWMSRHAAVTATMALALKQTAEAEET